jgi:transposase
MSKQRRIFSDEFKHEAVKLTRQPGATTAAIARDLDVSPAVLGRWAREQAEPEPQRRAANGQSVSRDEFERMRRDLAKVKMERDILKKALGYFAADPK